MGANKFSPPGTLWWSWEGKVGFGTGIPAAGVMWCLPQAEYLPRFLCFFTRHDVSMSLLETQTACMPVPKPTLPSHDHHRVPGGLNLLAPIEIT